MVASYRKPSFEDLSALCLARSLGVLLVTNDNDLRRAASEMGVTCHGTLWLLDELVLHGICEVPEAASALKLILEKGSRLPRAECGARLRRWRTEGD
ncbi:MAG: hypothetical protein ACYC5O_22030 [Anaerolineae bacterium]